MKKTIAKTAALIMAAMLAGSVCAPVTAFAYNAGSSTTSDESQVEMKAALTIAKKRVTIPAELSEFDYSTNEYYGTKSFRFVWHTKDSANEYRSITVCVTGGVITEYYDSKSRASSGTPSLAKLTNEKILEKAKGYIKQLNPDMASKVKLEIGSVSLFSNNVRVRFSRYENGIPVSGNGGSVIIDKDTGAMTSFNADWWDNAEFADPKGAKSEKEIGEAYKKLCDLTPYYRINTEWKEDKTTKKLIPYRTAEIVYQPDMNSEIDAFTGKKSTIWEDMKAAGGTRHYGGWDYADEDVAEECDSDAGLENPATGEVNFTPAELEKIQKDNNLIKTDKAFEMLKKDKFVALNDDYKLKSYEIYSTEDVKTGDETFYLDLQYTVKDELKDNYKGYKNINVEINAETGEVIYLNRYSSTASLPKLDVAKAKGIAESVAKTYSKDIFAQYKADKSNTSPVSSWTSGNKTYYETERRFLFNRFVNGIQVTGDSISVSVDSNGVVTSYSVNHTEDVTFVPNNILGKSEAFDKLYEQQAFDYYYDGWITKDGKVKTYLIYKMDSFYLNANTGKLCSWSGEKPYSYTSAEDVKYSDIKGIKQEEAIRTLQKYGVVLTTESKFEPNKLITEDEFMNLVTSALGGYAIAFVDEVEVEYAEEDMTSAKKTEAQKKAEAEKKDKAETTVKEAAVMFGKMYLSADIAKLNIFKSPFSDVKDSDENAGYIAVANAKGFITGANGKLNGDKKITRAEAAQIIYDYLKFLSK